MIFLFWLIAAYIFLSLVLYFILFSGRKNKEELEVSTITKKVFLFIPAFIIISRLCRGKLVRNISGFFASSYLGKLIKKLSKSQHRHKNIQSKSRRSPLKREMDIFTARDILGVSSRASKEEIIKAHRKLMLRFHPDRGGSQQMASKINLAKDVLIRNKD